MHQTSIPQAPVQPNELARKQTLGASIELCAELAGFSLDKELQQRMAVDKAQFSRWLGGTEGVVWPKLENLMDICGNDTPILWMAQRRGYDVQSMRKSETETERENRLLREENAALRRVVCGRRG